MGPKKQTPAARAAPPKAAASEPLADGAVTSNGVSASERLEYERALTALRRGNHSEALMLIKESCHRNETSLAQRVHATVCVSMTSVIDDPKKKSALLQKGLDAARRAVELSPNSIELSRYYANLLFEKVVDLKEYEDIVMECKRGLSIENPVDPAEDILSEDGLKQAPTMEARIVQVRDDLAELIQKLNTASISLWMENLGNGAEKFRVIPVRRPGDDPKEARAFQSKTPEEQRKEIEVRVAAARLMQMKLDVPAKEG